VIEYVRGVACGAVLLFHSLNALPPETLHPLLRFLRRFTEHGWLGIHAFFAVSGWCIAERLAKARRRREAAGAFLCERGLRIYPTYWVALAALVFIRMAASPFNGGRLENTIPSGVAAWLGDVLLVQPYFGTTPALIVSWTLVYELGFYALAAGALLFRRRGVPAPGLIGIGLLLCIPSALGWQSPFLHVLGLWPDFLVGALAWRASRSPSDLTARFSACALVSIFVLVLMLAGRFGGTGRLIAIGTSAALWLAARNGASPVLPDPLRGLAWLGGISYSLYLIHVTVLSPLTNLSTRFVRTDQAAFCAVWLVIVGLTLLAGWALHRWVEAPVERWRKSLWNRPPRPAS